MSLSIFVILFDVDGTIVDSAPAVMSTFHGALSGYDCPIPDDRRLRTYVGLSLWYSFGDLEYEGGLLTNLVSSYHSRCQAHFLDLEPFPGIIELLHELHNTGVPLVTMTSRQAPMALVQMEYLDLSSVSDVIAGATPDPASSKTTVIHEALTRLEDRGADISRLAIVGDSIWDVRGAKEASILVIGARWGYITDDGLADADAVCNTVDGLHTYLLNGVAQHARSVG